MKFRDAFWFLSNMCPNTLGYCAEVEYQRAKCALNSDKVKFIGPTADLYFRTIRQGTTPSRQAVRQVQSRAVRAVCRQSTNQSYYRFLHDTTGGLRAWVFQADRGKGSLSLAKNSSTNSLPYQGLPCPEAAWHAFFMATLA